MAQEINAQVGQYCPMVERGKRHLRLVKGPNDTENGSVEPPDCDDCQVFVLAVRRGAEIIVDAIVDFEQR